MFVIIWSSEMIEKYYPYEYVKNIYCIDYKKLWDMGFRGLVFDVDNTLVHHGDDSNEKVDRFFERLHKTISFSIVMP